MSSLGRRRMHRRYEDELFPKAASTNFSPAPGYPRQRYSRSPNATTTNTTMEHSPLGRLSPEIRNHIYELALAHDEPIPIAYTDSTAILRFLQPRNHILPLALTTTCSAIRMECTQLFFNINHFSVKVQPDGTDRVSPIARFLRAIGSTNAKALKQVTVQRKIRTIESRVDGLQECANLYYELKHDAKQYPGCQFLLKMTLKGGRVFQVDPNDEESCLHATHFELQELRAFATQLPLTGLGDLDRWFRWKYELDNITVFLCTITSTRASSSGRLKMSGTLSRWHDE
ncbi:hypothetical protein LTR17_005704 [Elasticomyces elasticus]|nr:hypothetical protein LTR17_005704 [Elasticomyces elasticus]